MRIKIVEGIVKYDGGIGRPGETINLNDAAAAVMIRAGDAVEFTAELEAVDKAKSEVRLAEAEKARKAEVEKARALLKADAEVEKSKGGKP